MNGTNGMKIDFLLAITQLTAEKNLPDNIVFDAVESALAAAYKRENNIPGQVFVNIDRESGEMRVWSDREVVEVEEDIADEDLQIDLDAAHAIDATIEIGGTLHETHTISPEAGRIAAQTAKQVVLQRLREAEREAIYEEFSGQEGEAVSGIILRMESRQVILDLGRTEALLPVSEQVRMEHYRSGQHLLVYVVEVQKGSKGPQVVVSRTHKNLIRRLFELEVPEVFKGLVEIKAIARDAGHRTKVAVHSHQEGLDPVGACVGMRGIRIQNIVNELQGERVDVIQWDPNPRKFVTHALSPAQVVACRVDAATQTAEVAVPDQQLSLAIGKEGQNARLAAQLTRMRIDVKPQSVAEQLKEQEIGPYAPQPESDAALLPATEAIVPEPVALPVPQEQEPEPVAVTPVPKPAYREVPPEEVAEEDAAEKEFEPALSAVEIASRETGGGRIRFAEDVLRRPAEETKPKQKRKRYRYVETDDGLEDDPYANYED